VLIAANRDEMLDRPWRPPARHWPDRPNVVAGLDELGGGSWFGINDDGVAVGIMNRAGTLGPAADKRSRGELVLEALDHADAETATEALSHIDPAAYRAFNLVIADSSRAFWLRHTEAREHGRIEVTPLQPGVSMFTAYDLNDETSARIRRYLPRVRAAAVPDPERDEWLAWEKILASRDADANAEREGAMNVVTDFGFGTVSSVLLALPARGRYGVRPQLRFAAGRPDQAEFRDVEL
jgi:uncharacterized protein with NRDE domain